MWLLTNVEVIGFNLVHIIEELEATKGFHLLDRFGHWDTCRRGSLPRMCVQYASKFSTCLDKLLPRLRRLPVFFSQKTVCIRKRLIGRILLASKTFVVIK